MRVKIIICALMLTGLFSSCSSYRYKPFKETTTACFNYGDSEECIKTPVYTDSSIHHEMTETELRFLPDPSSH